MKLYQDNGNFSPNAKRVRVACYEVGAPLEIIPMDYMKGDWSKPEYVAKNPMGKVPTVEDDGYVIWESPAILFHIASKYGDRGLIPNDTRGKTEMMRWLFWNASHLEPSVFAIAFEKLLKPTMNQPTDNARVESSTKDWERYAPILNAQLEGKPWILGDNLSIVDIAIGTTVEFATMSGLELKKHLHLAAWYGRITSRDAWKRASAK
jgi:glutathione S-transferase